MSCAYFKSIHQQTIDDIIFNIRPLIMQLLNIFCSKNIYGAMWNIHKKIYYQFSWFIKYANLMDPSPIIENFLNSKISS